jgi:hypothetical protein
MKGRFRACQYELHSSRKSCTVSHQAAWRPRNSADCYGRNSRFNLHEINQPAAAMVTNANAGLRWLTRATPDLDEARSSFENIVDGGSATAPTTPPPRNNAGSRVQIKVVSTAAMHIPLPRWVIRVISGVQ